jgi:hypothetical protein
MKEARDEIINMLSVYLAVANAQLFVVGNALLWYTGFSIHVASWPPYYIEAIVISLDWTMGTSFVDDTYFPHGKVSPGNNKNKKRRL